VIVNGTVLDKQGRKMSKSLKNTVDPIEVMNQFGADAVRWYFFSAVAIGNDYRFDITAVQDVVRRFLLILWNTYGFFVNYARLDGFDPNSQQIEVKRRALLDRWLLAELGSTLRDVEKSMEAYDPPTAARRLETFVLDLSQWYVRRSRRRFWKSESDSDKRSAYRTLYEVLLATVKMLAPFMPFVAETMYRNLANGLSGAAESVHLSDWPAASVDWTDDDLQREMAAVRRLVVSGLAARNAAGIKVRQPLRQVTIAEKPLGGELESILLEELNIKSARYQGEGGGLSLDTEITDDLRLEGLGRDIVRTIQELRKKCGFAVDDRIRLYYQGDGLLARALEVGKAYIAAETLAVAVERAAAPEGACSDAIKLDGQKLEVSVVRVGQR
jgi:isoleucyl-tRNA synthetase